MEPTTQNAAARMLDNVSRFILIAAAAVVPFFFLPFAWTTVVQSKMLVLAIGVVLVALLWAVARLIDGSVRLPRSALLYAGLFLVITYVVSAGVAGWPASALVGQGIEQDTLAAVTIFFSLFALTVLLFTNHTAAVRSAIRAFAIGATILFAYELLYIFFPETFALSALSGNTANPLGSWHDLGILAGLALFLAVSLFRSGLFPGLWRGLLIVLAILSLAVLVIVHFTDILWGTAALFALGFLASLRSNIQAEGLTFMQAIGRSIALLVLAVVLGLGAAFGAGVWEKLPAPILITQVEVRPSWQGTFDVGRQSLGAPATLLFGTGPNSFIREWGAHKPEGVNATPFWNSDFNYGVGIIPTSVFTAGLFATLAWVAIILILLGLFLRFIREVRPLSTGRMLFGFLLSGVAYTIVFHTIYTPSVALTGITFILLGLLAVVVAGDRPQRVFSTASATSASLFALIVLLAVPSVFAAGVVGREVASNMYVNRASTDFRASQNTGLAGERVDTALTISSRNDRAHRAAAELGLVKFAELAQQGEPTTEEARTALQETLQSTIQHGLTAIDIDSSNYQNWLVLAQVYDSLAGANVQGAYEEAKKNYDRAFETNPTNPVPKLRLAQLAIAQNDTDGARGYLNEALALKPDFAAALFLLSQVEASAGRGDVAVQAAAAAVQLVPDDPLGWFNLGYILYSGGVYADAAASLEQAVVRANDYSNALFFLGMSYHQLERPNDAVAAFQRVLELNPSETWIQEGIDAISRGEAPFVANQPAAGEAAPEE